MRGADECVAVQVGIVDGSTISPWKMAAMASPLTSYGVWSTIASMMASLLSKQEYSSTIDDVDGD